MIQRIRQICWLMAFMVFTPWALAARPSSADVVLYDALLDALEQRFAQILPTHQTSQWLDSGVDSAYLRYYSATQTYVAVYKDTLLYVGPLTNNQLYSLGPVKGSGGWLEIAGIQTAAAINLAQLTANAWYAGAGGTYGYCSGGVCSDSGSGQYYKFNADGTYVGAYRTQESCAGQITTMSGRYMIQGSTLTFTELSRHAQLIISCSGSLSPATTESPAAPYSYEGWFTAADGAGNLPPSGGALLYLVDRSRNVGSYFRVSTQ